MRWLVVHYYRRELFFDDLSGRIADGTLPTVDTVKRHGPVYAQFVGKGVDVGICVGAESRLDVLRLPLGRCWRVTAKVR